MFGEELVVYPSWWPSNKILWFLWVVGPAGMLKINHQTVWDWSMFSNSPEPDVPTHRDLKHILFEMYSGSFELLFGVHSHCLYLSLENMEGYGEGWHDARVKLRHIKDFDRCLCMICNYMYDYGMLFVFYIDMILDVYIRTSNDIFTRYTICVLYISLGFRVSIWFLQFIWHCHAWKLLSFNVSFQWNVG